MISSSLTMFLFPSTGLMLVGKFTSLDEPTKVYDVVTVAVLPAYGPEGIEIKGEQRRETQRES
jgi:hypothetical protein